MLVYIYDVSCLNIQECTCLDDKYIWIYKCYFTDNYICEVCSDGSQLRNSAEQMPLDIFGIMLLIENVVF